MSLPGSAESARDRRVILPGKTVGILGGGQLGRMIVLEGRRMGYRFQTLDPTPDSPCGQVADKQVVGPFHSLDHAYELASQCDVVTYEFENVDAGVTDILQEESYVPQGSELLSITQHRIREKTAVSAIGVPVAPFKAVRSEADLPGIVEELGFPCIMKTATGGYDGKGQAVLRSLDDAVKAYRTLSRRRDRSDRGTVRPV